MEEKARIEYWQLVKELIDETFGCASIRSIGRWNDSNYLDADIQLSTNLLKGSIHEVKNDTQFIHYTSVQTLFEILNSKKLRLFNAIHMNDPLELLFSLNAIEDLSPQNVEEQIKNFFLISFCEYDSSVEKKEHFSMWRNYGDNGNGVGIIFKLANYNLDNRWIDSALGKISYDTDSQSLKGIRNYFQKLKSEDKFSIQNLPNIIFQLASFHKAPIWSEENEIRLCRFLKWDKLRWKYEYDNNNFTREIKTTFQNNELKYFIEMELDNRLRLESAQKIFDSSEVNNAFDIYPALKIEKIIFGYRISNDIKHEIGDASRLLAFQNLGITLQFDNSIFTPYFKK
jgi:hypothetical protein